MVANVNLVIWMIMNVMNNVRKYIKIIKQKFNKRQGKLIANCLHLRQITHK